MINKPSMYVSGNIAQKLPARYWKLIYSEIHSYSLKQNKIAHLLHLMCIIHTGRESSILFFSELKQNVQESLVLLLKIQGFSEFQIILLYWLHNVQVLSFFLFLSVTFCVWESSCILMRMGFPNIQGCAEKQDKIWRENGLFIHTLKRWKYLSTNLH